MIDDAYTPEMLCGQCGVVLPCFAHQQLAPRPSHRWFCRDCGHSHEHRIATCRVSGRSRGQAEDVFRRSVMPRVLKP